MSSADAEQDSRSATAIRQDLGGQARDATASDPQRAEEAQEVDSSTPLLSRQSGDALPPRVAKRWFTTFRLLGLLVLAAVLVLVFRHISSPTRRQQEDNRATSSWTNATLTNGTHTFRRTVILISLDGAKPSYLDAGLAPHLQSLGTSTPSSRRARFLQPIFPTLTFPNHWALLTGLFASSHGIVANDFSLASSGKQFYYTDPSRSWYGSWWLGEPIWATAQRAGLFSAVLMWPGPPVTSAESRPKYFQKYVSSPEWDLNGRLRQVLKWIDMEDVEDRPSLVCAYVPNIDQAAHKFGPESQQARQAVEQVDAFIGQLKKELVEKRQLGGVVDIVVVSDHGMTTTSNHKLIFLDKLLGEELYAKVEHRDGWPLAGLRFRGKTEAEQQDYAQQAYDKLSNGDRREYEVYWREDLPVRFHLSSPLVEDRLAPLWMIPKLRWSITDHPEMATFADGVYGPIGNHGYDNEEEEMHALFVASGPSFSNVTMKGKKKWNMEGFRNVEVHNLVSRILGIPETIRAPTNGSWGFWDAHLRAGL